MNTSTLATILALSTAACAGTSATTGGLGRGAVDHTAAAALTLEPVGPESTISFPALRSEARLPSADRLGRRIEHEQGGQISTGVRLCVAGDGRVADVEVTDASAMPAFDQAVQRDLAGWRFAASPGPDAVRVCQRMTIGYLAP
ncbi:MAG: hypothetical protein KBG28_14615 [Kofleriaceae bacterium]|nr:hypothetical protein [Kofleriaceae bacterium]MBP6836079.1 hypothetical protein [Kofleriaceae bacterium]MBP9205199.1 hypothetical protein [Kofleriaceae bacterium]